MTTKQWISWKAWNRSTRHLNKERRHLNKWWHSKEWIWHTGNCGWNRSWQRRHSRSTCTQHWKQIPTSMRYKYSTEPKDRELPVELTAQQWDVAEENARPPCLSCREEQDCHVYIAVLLLANTIQRYDNVSTLLAMQCLKISNWRVHVPLTFLILVLVMAESFQ